MNFQDLEDIWNENNQDLEQSITINSASINNINMKKVTSNLTETRWENLIELGVNLWFLSFFKNFFMNHYHTPKFLIPGAFMLGLCLFAIVFCTYKLFLISRINRNYPIVKAQRNLALIQYFNRLEINALFFLIPTFSLAFLIVAAKGFIGMDLYAIGFPFIPYLVGSFLVGVIIILFIKIFPDKKLQETITYLKELKDLD